MSEEQMNGKGAFARACLLFWSVAVCLLALYYLPERVGGWELKPVDLFGRLRVDSLVGSEGGAEPNALLEARRQSLLDSLGGRSLTPEMEEIRRRDSIYNSLKNTYSASVSTQAKESKGELTQSPEGVATEDTPPKRGEDLGKGAEGQLIPIQDFSPRHDGLKHFYDALRDRQRLGRPIRIAVLGDSFIEGDIFTAPLRKDLQRRYGGAGIGWMPMSSEIASFRTSIRHRSSGWREETLVTHARSKHLMTGRRFVPSSHAWTEYAVVKGDRGFSRAIVYYTSSSDVTVQVISDDSVRTTLTLPASHPDQMGQADLGEMTKRKLRLELASNLGDAVFYGVSLEDKGGVTLDNMSLRGSSGLPLGSLSEPLSHSWSGMRPYDLIVLEFGLNVANDKQKDYSQWSKRMGGIIKKLQVYYPEASILLLGVSDRGKRTGQGVETMPSVLLFHRAQEELASELGLPLWSLLSAVKSVGGISEMANRGCAAKDYTHMTSKGGMELSRMLMQALDLEQKYYDAISE